MNILKKISDFTDVITGGTPSTTKAEYWDGNIPWLNSGVLNDGDIKKPSKYITELGLKNSSARLMPPDSILIALTGATTGQVGYLHIEASANQSVTGILPSKQHNPRYLYYYLQTQKKKIRSEAFGGAQPHINQQYVKDIEIPLPPLEDQIRIADILTRAEKLIAKRKECIKRLDEFLKSTFLEMFGDPVKNEKRWERVTIRDLIKEAKYGTSKSADGGEYKYLRMNNITTEGYWDFSNLKYITAKDSDKEKYVLRKNDLVFNRTNSKELVGKTAVYSSDEEVIIAGYLIRVRTNTDANPWYIWAYLNSKAGKLRLFNLCRNIVGMANINAQELQDIPILKPPVELQNKFADIVEKIEGMKIKYNESLVEMEKLYCSLSQRAFRGDLTPGPSPRCEG